MARPKPNPDVVFPLIIEQARRLIQEDGFEKLTMKGLAEACGMSVGKLYHFFASKDELFLRLETEYFDGLYAALMSSLHQANELEASPRVSFRALVSAYYRYAVAQIDLYQLVTSPPKVYSHYLGTEIEALAKRELESAMRVIQLFRAQLGEALQAGNEQGSKTLQASFLMSVNAVHGLILMSCSAVWPYLSEDWRRDEQLEVEKAEVVEKQLDLIVASVLG